MNVRDCIVTARSGVFDKVVAYFLVSLKTFYQLNKLHDVERECSYDYWIFKYVE
jgi:hypothetical protein